MTKIRHVLLAASCLLVFGGFQTASAAIITSSLGNTASGLSDGDTPTLLPDISNAQAGQAAPFDTGCGGLFSSCSTGWQFNYGAIADPILSATIDIGIWGHDSSANDSQLSAFSVDGQDLSATLDVLFEASGGAFEEYNVYSVSLGAGLFADLADGVADILFALKGPGLVFEIALFDGCGCVIQSDTNGANLIFSTLTIETQDVTIPPIPIPAAAPLFLSALALMGLYRRRVLRNQG